MLPNYFLPNLNLLENMSGNVESELQDFIDNLAKRITNKKYYNAFQYHFKDCWKFPPPHTLTDVSNLCEN